MRARRAALREYFTGAMWILPTLSVLLALILGSALSQVDISPGSRLHVLTFQGTADDARTLLIAVTTTMVTVIALVLGLTVVAFQLSSTQYSPRLLRNFLRDRPNQVVLSMFVATFAYSAAGLYTVGVSGGTRTEEYPRLAVSGALLLTFASLGALVYFTNHLAHSLQIDEIMRVVERRTLAVIGETVPGNDAEAEAWPPWAAPLLAERSGYVQAVHPEAMLPAAVAHAAQVRFAVRPAIHVVAGTPIAWVWRASGDAEQLAIEPFRDVLGDAIKIGFERTTEQDAALGLRQLVDVASKALSPAVNDPYTAVQAVHHLSVLMSALGGRRLGAYAVRQGGASVSVPAHTFADFLVLSCAQIRRYGSSEPLLDLALLQLLSACLVTVGSDTERAAAIHEQARLVLTAAERSVTMPEDLAPVRTAAESLLAQRTGAHRMGH
ncbi:MAG: DUF2254 domain-containing protein [Nocardioidaceae bacterium]